MCNRAAANELGHVHTEKRIMQSTIVSFRAWGYKQPFASGDFQTVIGWIHGQIVKETDESIVIAFQVFDDGVRHVVTIPTECILERIEYQPCHLQK